MWHYVTGSVIGVISGLLPGFHINNVALLLFKYYLLFNQAWAGKILLTAIITNAVFSYLAAIYFNIADNDSSFASTLSMKFAKHNLLKDYLLLAYLGISNTTILLALVLPLLIKYHAILYKSVLPYMPLILLLLIMSMLWKAKKQEVFVGIASSLLGYLAFSSSSNTTYVLLPIFFGMFGIPAYFITKTTSPSIRKGNVKISKKEIRNYWIASIIGLIAAYVSSLFPATSPLLFFAPLAKYLKTPKEAVVSLASMTFSDALISIFTIPLTHNSRSGAGVILQNMYELTTSSIITIPLIASLLLLIYYPLYIFLIKKSHVFVKLKPIIYAFLVIYILLTTKFVGILLLINASLIGIYAIKTNTSPSYLLFVILIPTTTSMLISL